jgi:hypothetical protein
MVSFYLLARILARFSCLVRKLAFMASCTRIENILCTSYFSMT